VTSWDRDVPIPTKRPKWDFENAQIGWSMVFETKVEAHKFANALRVWARVNGKNWGALIGPEYRVWIVEKRARKARIVKERVEQSKTFRDSRFPYNVVPIEISAENNAPRGALTEPSTDTDEDIMLSVDTRKSGGVTIGKQPEARPVEVADEITPTGRRKRKRADAL
jgi:hypothetical protein